MDTTYYEAVSAMERMGVDREYLQGWIGGYLGNPKREPQRLSDAYEAGYTDGRERDTTHFAEWTRS